MSKLRVLLVGFVASGLAVGLLPAMEAAQAATEPSVTVGGLSVTEADAGAVQVKVPIALSAPAAVKVVAKWKLVGASATAGSDFVAKSASTSFLVGQTEKWAVFTLNGDAAVEPDEQLTVALTSVTGAAVGDGAGEVTIADNDANGVSTAPEVTAGDPTIWEGDSGTRQAQVPVALSVPAPTNITVWFKTNCSTGDVAYTSVNKKVTFLAGQQVKYVSVKVSTNTAPGDDPTIADGLSLGTGSAALPSPEGSIAVLDDDANGGSPVEPAIGTLRASEPASGIDPSFETLECGAGIPESGGGSITADGRFVAFDSLANNLVDDDTNGQLDVFVKDLWSGAIERVSVATDGSEGNAGSSRPTISADGRYVAFDSSATNLVPDDLNGWSDAFLFDRATGSIERIGGVNDWHDGTNDASISADGRYVAFTSDAALAGDTDPCVPQAGSTVCDLGDVFVLDRTTGALHLMSAGVEGAPSWGMYPAISADGSTVAYFAGDTANVVVGDANGTVGDVFARDRVSGAVEMVSVNDAGEPSQGWGVYPQRPSLSADGSRIAFAAELCNLGVPCAPVGRSPFQAYVRDRVSDLTLVASLRQDGSAQRQGPLHEVSISGDGRYVAFETGDTVLYGLAGCGLSGPDLGGSLVYQRDLVAGTTAPVSTSFFGGGCPNGSSSFYRSTGTAMSADGRYVVYYSGASDLIEGDGDNAYDVFVTRLR